jgi:hypothetical protein
MYENVACGRCGTSEIAYVDDDRRNIIGCTACNRFWLSHSREAVFSLSPAQLASLLAAIEPIAEPSQLSTTKFGRWTSEFLLWWKRSS